jgi:hypothetical protein
VSGADRHCRLTALVPLTASVPSYLTCPPTNRRTVWQKDKGQWDNTTAWYHDNRRQCSEYEGCQVEDADTCYTFQSIIGRLPNFSPAAEILTFTGLNFRVVNSNGTVGGTQDDAPSDDTLPFLACNALPPGPLICPNGLTNGA